ncbi:solute carrier family 13 (sodium-dependent dicarboxylate transporter), member 2/3/5 [Paragonimus westermani]|uniref:Solute carrier family 13 (Sodium-dependent dicarboxylate transporter), member 2/3/5 n=1 Tax=Paragonimus westermani TaxID=34504 RepID=A0A5J4NII2_9TREM|nr:solute carrier family 13 (sodium-dependent dicarboxylate transporter), member 2/3/5 [Paragonimus westermani]
MAGYWTTEVIPIYVTALLPILLGPLFGVLTSNSVTVAYMKDTNMLFLGGILVACAIEHRRLHRRIAIKVLKLVGSDPKITSLNVRRLILGFMLPTWFLSMWMSNTATTAMMVTIVEAVLISLNSIEQNVEQNAVTSRKTPSKHPGSRFMKNTHDPNEDVCSEENQMALEPASILIVDACETTDERPKNNLKTNELSDSMTESIETVRKLNKALSLCVCYASTCGGIGTVTGTAPNSIFFGQVNSLFGSDTGLNFSTWMAFACPISIILLLLIWGWLTIRYFGLRYAEGMCCVLFVLITALWTTRNVGELGWGKYFKNPSGQTFVTDTQPAILVALLALILPAVNPVQLYQRRAEYRGDATVLANLQDHFLLPWHVAQKRCPWGVLIILGGGYALSDICQSSGLSDLVGQTLGERVGGLSTTALIFVCCLISATVTEFTSNAATVSILLPIVFSLVSFKRFSNWIPC